MRNEWFLTTICSTISLVLRRSIVVHDNTEDYIGNDHLLTAINWTTKLTVKSICQVHDYLEDHIRNG